MRVPMRGTGAEQSVRSGDEGSVMELDRRDCVVWLYLQVNQKWEEPCG
jgi:hypothetical protein